MKKLSLFVALCLVAAGTISCGGSSDFFSSKENFAKAEKQIVSKFGDNAWFTQLSVALTPPVGSMILVNTTGDPKSLKMEGWIQMRGVWKKDSDISLTTDDADMNPADYMFQLGKDLDWSKVWELAQKSKQTILDEGHLGKDIVVKMVMISIPDGREKSDLMISVSVEPASGGTSTMFNYDRDGNLLNRN